MRKNLLFILLITMVGFITACSKNISPETYSGSEVGVSSKVVPGVIIAKRQVKIDNSSNVGGLAGAGAGAVGGSAIGGGARTNIAGAIGGAVIGGVVGNAADKAVNWHKGYEYIIRLKNGSTISIAQHEDVQFEVNQHVLIIYGAMTRIIPDTTSESRVRRK